MSEQTPDLTSPANVATGEQVYQQIEAGQVADATAALDAAYGRTGEES